MQSARQSDAFPQCPFLEIIRALCGHQALMHSSSLWCGHHARRSSPEQNCFRYFSKQSQRGIKVGNRESWAPSSRSITSVSSLASRRGQPKLTIIRRCWLDGFKRPRRCQVSPMRHVHSLLCYESPVHLISPQRSFLRPCVLDSCHYLSVSHSLLFPCHRLWRFRRRRPPVERTFSVIT
jgi:hypothetical protein